MSSTPLLAQGLVRRFGEEIAVDHIDLSVASGEIHAIVGLNGAGKTTLMRLLLGMVRADSGVAQVMGTEVASAPARVWAQVGHLIESPFAYPELTARENLSASALLHGIDGAAVSEAVDGVIAEFQLGHWADKRAGSLSSGNRQRLGLASAVVHRPSILVLDEPANALDPAGVVFIRDLMGESAARGAAVLVSSHHLDQLARVAHRITVMHRGRVVGTLHPDWADLERRFFDIVTEADLTTREATR